MCHTIISRLDKTKGKFNYIQFIVFRYYLTNVNNIIKLLNFLRYLRLVPIMVVGVTISFLFEFIGDGTLWQIKKNIKLIWSNFKTGPFWGNINKYIGGPCYDQWYKPLLMMSNIFPYINDNTKFISPLMV